MILLYSLAKKTTHRRSGRLRNLSPCEHSNTDRTRFEETGLLYIPATGQKSAEWVKCTNCVWNGPKYLKSKLILRQVPEYTPLESFLLGTVHVSDPTPEDVLICILDLKDANDSPDKEELHLMYRDLYHEFRHDSQWGYLR